MLLFEFDQRQDSATIAQIVALINQLEQEIEDGEVDPNNYSVDNLLDYFQQYDIILDANDLYNMIKVPPLKDVISNIQGDKVVFKGHQGKTTLDAPEDEDKKTVAKMAKHALKK
jgi:hypothetical protein